MKKKKGIVKIVLFGTYILEQGQAKVFKSQWGFE